MNSNMKKYRLLLGMLFASVMLNGCVLDVNDDDKLPGDKFWREGNVENVEAFMLVFMITSGKLPW